MYKKIIQIIIIIFVVPNNLPAQNSLEIKSEVKGNYDEQRSLNISVNDSGEELYNFEKSLMPHQSIPQIEVLSNNNLLLVHSLEGIFELYNTNGTLISKNEFYNLPPYNEQKIKYHVNNSSIAFLISEAKKNELFLINNSGEIEFSKKVSDGLISGVASTNDAELIAYSIMNWNANDLQSETTLLNIENNSEVIFSNRFEKGTFNEDEKLFLGFTNNSSFLIDIPEERILFENYLPGNKIYIDAEIQNEKAVFVMADSPNLVNKEWIYKDLAVIQKDTLGNERVLYSVTRNVKKVNLAKLQNKIEVELDNESVIIEVN